MADIIGKFIERHGEDVLEALLVDQTTHRNIIWADNEYSDHGYGFDCMDEISISQLTGKYAGLIRTRADKAMESQSQRTRVHAEVFTPAWLCNRMNNDIDREWFGKDVFTVDEGKTWKRIDKGIAFPKVKGHGWKPYVESPRLEITCGEAPFICSPYDTVTGEPIEVADRIGFLDRKLRVVSEHARSRGAWFREALVALKATYGYEYQGDNLLLARINVFETICDHCAAQWGDGLSEDEKQKIADVISWNLWQMDGLTRAVPIDAVDSATHSVLAEHVHDELNTVEPFMETLFDFDDEPIQPALPSSPLCLIYDWEEDKPIEFASLGGR